MASFADNFRQAFGQQPFTKYDPIGEKRRESAIKNEKSTPSQETKGPSVVPKAPSFRYKNDDNIAYWMGFADSGTMRHYNDLMDILGDIEGKKSIDDIKTYVDGVKDTTMYKLNPGVQTWTSDLESLYSQIDEKNELSYPIELMRAQTVKAKNEFENGYRNRSYNEPYPYIPSPSELLPKIADSFISRK